MLCWSFPLELWAVSPPSNQIMGFESWTCYLFCRFSICSCGSVLMLCFPSTVQRIIFLISKLIMIDATTDANCSPCSKSMGFLNYIFGWMSEIRSVVIIFTCFILWHKIHNFMSNKFILKCLLVIKMMVATKWLNETIEVVIMINIEKWTLMTLFAQTNDGYNDNQPASVFLHPLIKEVFH